MNKINIRKLMGKRMKEEGIGRVDAIMTDPRKDNELIDVKKVDKAISALASGDINTAEKLLMAVIENTPSNYTNVVEDEDTIWIKSWDLENFLHYCYFKSQETEKNIIWIPNAYPRAYYHIGVISVEKKQYHNAIEFLDKGQLLEPTNYRFQNEKAVILLECGRKEEALALYDEVNENAIHVCASELARAMRGRGAGLIELNRLDEAEEALKASLKIDPDSKLAHNELHYIDYLRHGGEAKNGIPILKPIS